MKIVVAPDSFKGCCTAQEAATALRQGVSEILPDAEVLTVPLADGGEGTTCVLVSSLQGQWSPLEQGFDALQRPVLTRYGYLPSTCQVVMEAAETIGLPRLKKEERNPIQASSYGLGYQLVQAFDAGYRHFLIGLGGTATCDGGKGMLRAIRERFGSAIPSIKIDVLCDVNNPLFGPQGAACIFAPQKGANPDEIVQLDQNLRAMAVGEKARFAQLPGAGAGGGLGFALAAYLDANLLQGSKKILEILHFNEKISNADLIITGEGKMDGQTLCAKLPSGVLKAAMRQSIPVVGVAGKVEQQDALLRQGFLRIYPVNPPGISDEMALQTDYALSRLTLTAKQICKDVLLGKNNC